MDKTQQTEMLKQALDEIPSLRARHYSDGALAEWKNKVSRMMETAFGAESTQYRRFINATGTAFIVRTEMGQTQEYHRQLDCYEDVLKSLLSS